MSSWDRECSNLIPELSVSWSLQEWGASVGVWVFCYCTCDLFSECALTKKFDKWKKKIPRREPPQMNCTFLQITPDLSCLLFLFVCKLTKILSVLPKITIFWQINVYLFLRDVCVIRWSNNSVLISQWFFLAWSRDKMRESCGKVGLEFSCGSICGLLSLTNHLQLHADSTKETEKIFWEMSLKWESMR